MVRPKKYTSQAISGERGINLIQRRVLEMGFAWHGRSLDAGIDGIIEIRDATSGDATNLLLQVQSKALSGRFLRETQSTFEYACAERDIQYWLGANAPVILVVSRPETDEAFWVSVADQFAKPAERRRHIATFDKTRDRLDGAAAQRLIDLASSNPQASVLPLARGPETLVSNLLPLVRLPGRIWAAPTRFRKRKSVWSKLKGLGLRAPAEWILRDRQLYSVHDLRAEPWLAVCNARKARSFAVSHWARANDRAGQDKLKEILRPCVRTLASRHGVGFDHRRRIYYFWKRPDGQPRTVRFKNRKVQSQKTVARPYYNDRTGAIRYYRHLAFDAYPTQFDHEWFLEVAPTYHYTLDGARPYPWYEDALKKMRELERNEVVEANVRLIASVLSGCASTATPLLEGAPYAHLAIGPALCFEVEQGLDDAAWLPPAVSGDRATDEPTLWEQDARSRT